MKIAVLYQIKEPPADGNIRKPMKNGGYRDSGADIAVELRKNGIDLALPTSSPSEQNDLDWVFGDDDEGISKATDADADTLWLNTVLYSGHPIEKYMDGQLRFIGQRPSDVQKYDNKLYTNRMLLKHGLPIAECISVSTAEEYDGEFPCVIKPIRGRGSQGVYVVRNADKLHARISELKAAEIYGTEFMLEPYLPGEEITVAVFPADDKHSAPYCLPPVVRFNHINGIAPYSGIVAVSKNSRAADSCEAFEDIMYACSEAYKALDLKAPIRIDCRKGADNTYRMFDINMKPNMTLASRQHRQNQDSLVMLAARAAGMTSFDLLSAFLSTAWS